MRALWWGMGLLSGGAAVGLVLVAMIQVAPSVLRRGWPGAVHGGLGLAGFVALVWGLRGPARGVASGAGSFGGVAAGFVAAALAGGAVLAWARWRGRAGPMLVVGLHATAGVAGVVMLAAYLSG